MTRSRWAWQIVLLGCLLWGGCRRTEPASTQQPQPCATLARAFAEAHHERDMPAAIEWIAEEGGLDRFDRAKVRGDGGLDWLSNRIFESSQRGRVLMLSRGFTQTSDDVWFVVRAATGVTILHTEWPYSECEDTPEDWQSHGYEVRDAGKYIVIAPQCALHRHPAAVGAPVWLLDVEHGSADGRPAGANARIASGTESPHRITLDVEGRSECGLTFDPGE